MDKCALLILYDCISLYDDKHVRWYCFFYPQKAGGSREHLAGLDVTVLPSPDNGEIGVSLMLPPKTPSFPITHTQAELQFNLHCKMVTKLANKTLSCKVGTESSNRSY